MNERDLEDQIRSLYGDVAWTRARGILHVMAIVDREDALIAIGPAAPHSEIDRFVLGLASARSELILTTGAILRSEPVLEHRYAEDAETNGSFVGWRRKALGLEGAPALCVVSRSGKIPENHPALRFARAGMVWTSKAGRERLGPSLGRLSVEVGISGGGVAASLGALLRRARSRFRAQTILLEAGPTISAEFYRRPQTGCPRIDELLLSRFEGAARREAIGPSFESRAAIRELFPDPPTSRRIDAPSGAWNFDRYRASVSDGSPD